jgi:Lrp/AsnC family leucine-responsive transcriptional regulator
VRSSRPLQLDDLDHKLLECLQQDAGRTLDELGEAVGLSASAVQRRIKRYRSSRLITRQIAVLDPEAVSGVVLAAVFVTLENESIREHRAFRQRLPATPEVKRYTTHLVFDVVKTSLAVSTRSSPGIVRPPARAGH